VSGATCSTFRFFRFDFLSVTLGQQPCECSLDGLARGFAVDSARSGFVHKHSNDVLIAASDLRVVYFRST